MDSAASLLCAVTDEDYPAISLETYEGVGDIYAGLCNVYSNLSAKLYVGRKQELSDEISQAAISANAAMSKNGKPVGSALDDVQFFMGECINYLNNAEDDVIPVLLADTTQEEFASIVEDIRFADSRLPAELLMGTEVYTAFREWAGGVKGATGDALADEAAVVANAHASPCGTVARPSTVAPTVTARWKANQHEASPCSQIQREANRRRLARRRREMI